MVGLGRIDMPRLDILLLLSGVGCRSIHRRAVGGNEDMRRIFASLPGPRRHGRGRDNGDVCLVSSSPSSRHFDEPKAILERSAPCHHQDIKRTNGQRRTCLAHCFRESSVHQACLAFCRWHVVSAIAQQPTVAERCLESTCRAYRAQLWENACMGSQYCRYVQRACM